MKLKSKNLTLSLELAGLIVSKELELPRYIDAKEYKQWLNETFKHDYEEIDINNELDLLLGEQQEELIVYPDDNVEGI